MDCIGLRAGAYMDPSTYLLLNVALDGTPDPGSSSRINHEISSIHFLYWSPCPSICCFRNFNVYLFSHYSSIPVILNRGPHGPPGGNLQVLGGNTEHLGNWGGMDPFGGNQQIAINSPGCSSGWRIVAASQVFYQRITT